MSNVCRLCLKVQKKENLTTNIFQDSSGNEAISSFLFDIFQVQVGFTPPLKPTTLIPPFLSAR